MAKNILGIDDHYLRYPKDEWGWTDLNNPDMVNPWIDINKIINPKKVIEIGMFAGHASLIMMTVFKNLEYLVIDCLWLKYHPSHLNLKSCLKLISLFKPKKTILTNLHSDLDYDYLKKVLPKNVYPAFDGLTIDL